MMWKSAVCKFPSALIVGLNSKIPLRVRIPDMTLHGPKKTKRSF